MKNSLIILFLLFSYFSIDYWTSWMMLQDDYNGSTRYIVYSVLLVEFLCASSLIISSKIIKHQSITKAMVLWAFAMLGCMFVNHGNLQDIVLTLFVPILFLGVYQISQCNDCKLSDYTKMFVIIFIYGLCTFAKTFLSLNMEGQTNSIYFVLLTMPWILSLENKKARWILFAIISIAALYSFKRSCFLIIASMILYIAYSRLREGNGLVKKVFISLIIIGAALMVVLLVDNMSGGFLTERLNREETDEGRNRLAIWEVTTTMIMDSSPLEWLIGHGHYGVKKNSILEITAHNDFLEVLYDYGLIIFSLYLALWKHVVKTAFFLVKKRSEYAMAYMSSLFIFICMSLVSHLILYTSYFMFLIFFWAVIAGMQVHDRTYGTNKLRLKV